MCARGFWNVGQLAFFDVSFFNPNTTWYDNTEIGKCYELNERKKKRKYNEPILNVKQGGFKTFAMFANRGFSKECTKFCGKLAELIANKRI